MLNFVICDDNLAVTEKLSKMFENIFFKYDYPAKVTLATNKAKELLKHVSENKVDVLVLDINLHSDITGLEIAEKVRKINKDCYIIFTTAHLEYALVAYKYKTFDYLSKPITTERLEETVVRLFEDLNGEPRKYIKLDNKNTIINEDEIEYIKRDGMKIVFHTESRDYELYSSFAKLKGTLPENFVRCHKSFIANINNISKVEPVSNLVYFGKNSTCDIGPKYKNNFMEVIKNYGNIK